MQNKRIEKITSREILDSRGNPTVSTSVTLCDGTTATASVPSGASTGSFEAYELRDKDEKRFGGRGVMGAVENVREKIAPEIISLNTSDLGVIDRALLKLDGTDNLSKLGANAVLSVSMAVAKANAKSMKIPLFQYLGGINGTTLPVPMMNILNGGAHASNNIDIQEFMIMPVGFKTFREGVQACCEVYHILGGLLMGCNLSKNVGDEGGYAPSLDSEEDAILLIIEAIKKAGYNTDQIKLALDVASGEWQHGGGYIMPKSQKAFTSDELISHWEKLCEKYPIISIEDPIGENDFEGWGMLTKRMGKSVQLVGDDFFVTNPARLKKGINEGCANAILVKVNQIGTLTEAFKAVNLAKRHGYNTIISHRSGETEDTTIADIAVGLNAGQIKTGAPCRSERTAKYNRLMMIEDCLGKNSHYFKIKGR
ncbi:MAG: phosphopyruvate hydratase [Oscillospiraceae bacterium]|nr:phosphopyruvate hydratase [Oscillospiraceae bacterium]